MKRVYKNREYVIYRTEDGYIVQNILISGFAHTHIESYQTAKRIVSLSINKKLPRDLSDYLVISLIRISSDENYKTKAKQLLENRRKKQRYFNSNKGVVKK